MAGSRAVLASQPTETTHTGDAQSPEQTRKYASKNNRAKSGGSTAAVQLAKLKKGPKVSISVGPEDNQYIAIEGAHINLVTAYWGYASRVLSSGITTLFVEGGMKSTIQWIYAYMLAGETDAHNHPKLKAMTLTQLADLYDHAVYLEYAALKARLLGILKFRLHNEFPTVDEIQAIAYHAPVLSEFMMKSVTARFTQPLEFDYTPYMVFAANNREFEAALDESVPSSFEYLIERGIKYYNSPHHARHMRWVERYGLGRVAETGRGTTGTMAPAALPNTQPAAQPSVAETEAPTSTPVNQKPHGPFGKRSSSKSGSDNSKPPPVCYNCQTRGHFARECTNATVSRTKGGCYNCKKPGHFASDCAAPYQYKKPTEYLDTGRAYNVHKRRARAERAGEDDGVIIQLMADGEGVQTCTRAVNAGEVTRTGLTV